MKIRGRFIGILAVLGLLMASGSACHGRGCSRGCDPDRRSGQQGQFLLRPDGFQHCHNRRGGRRPVTRHGLVRRGSSNEGGPDFNLSEGIVGGEMEQVDEFDGGPSNPVCVDSDDDDNVDRPFDANRDQRPPGCGWKYAGGLRLSRQGRVGKRR